MSILYGAPYLSTPLLCVFIFHPNSQNIIFFGLGKCLLLTASFHSLSLSHITSSVLCTKQLGPVSHQLNTSIFYSHLLNFQKSVLFSFIVLFHSFLYFCPRSPKYPQKRIIFLLQTLPSNYLLLWWNSITVRFLVYWDQSIILPKMVLLHLCVSVISCLIFRCLCICIPFICNIYRT